MSKWMIIGFMAAGVLFAQTVWAEGCNSWIYCAAVGSSTTPAVSTSHAKRNYHSASQSSSVSRAQRAYYNASRSAQAYSGSRTYSQYATYVWKDQYADYDKRLMPKQINYTGKPVFVFSPKVRQWGAYNASGNLVGYGRANGGADYCSDIDQACRTPKGSYKIYRKGPVDCVSSKFPVGEGGAKMPHCMFFRGGYAIHGSPQISMSNSSHGCIRVTVDAARWLYNTFIQHGTRVLVLSY